MARSACFLFMLVTFVAASSLKHNLDYGSTSSFTLRTFDKLRLSRTKRDADDSYAKFEEEHCCNSAQKLETSKSKEMDEDVKTCMTEIKNKFGPGVTDEFLSTHLNSNETTCFTECLFRLNNLTDTSGNLLAKNATDHFVGGFGFAGQEAVTKIQAVCPLVTEANIGGKEGTYQCSRVPLRFLICANDMNNLFCPAGAQIKSDKCTKCREALKTLYS